MSPVSALTLWLKVLAWRMSPHRPTAAITPMKISTHSAACCTILFIERRLFTTYQNTSAAPSRAR